MAAKDEAKTVLVDAGAVGPPHAIITRDSKINIEFAFWCTITDENPRWFWTTTVCIITSTSTTSEDFQLPPVNFNAVNAVAELPLITLLTLLLNYH